MGWQHGQRDGGGARRAGVDSGMAPASLPALPGPLPSHSPCCPPAHQPARVVQHVVLPNRLAQLEQRVGTGEVLLTRHEIGEGKGAIQGRDVSACQLYWHPPPDLAPRAPSLSWPTPAATHPSTHV